jgi:hypothetical protein
LIAFVSSAGRACVGQRLVEIGGPARDVELLGEPLDLAGVAADQDRVRHHAIAIGKLDATLLADRNDRANQMLVQPHAAGDPVHDQAETLGRHKASLPRSCFRSEINPLDKYCLGLTGP